MCFPFQRVEESAALVSSSDTLLLRVCSEEPRLTVRVKHLDSAAHPLTFVLSKSPSHNSQVRKKKLT